MRRGRPAWRVGLAAAAMVLAAEAAVWLLRPRESPIQPAPVRESDYFTPAQIDRGRSFSDGQLVLFAVGLVAEGVVLVALATGHPAPVRRGLERLGRRPVLGAAAAGAGVSIAVGLVGLPVGIAAHERAVDYGISTQTLGSWLNDTGKSAAISAVFAAAGGALFMALLRRYPRRWWIPGSFGVVAIAVVFTWLAPVVLAPIFNRFEPLPQGSRARAQVLELGRRAGVDIGQVYRVDASRRVRSLNAYVDGIGSTKRVVLYDNLLKKANGGELRAVVAHELGHVAHDDVPRGLAFVALVAPFGLIFARELGDGVMRRRGLAAGTPSALPAYILGIAAASLVLGIVGNQLSRKIEASADTFALDLTHDPHAMIQVQRQLAISSVANPSPPGLVEALLGTHPSTMDRIGAAVAYEQGARG